MSHNQTARAIVEDEIIEKAWSEFCESVRGAIVGGRTYVRFKRVMQAALAAERERCAKVALAIGKRRDKEASEQVKALKPNESGDALHGVAALCTAEEIAAAIRRTP